MRKFTGTVRKNDLEGGFWELVDEHGTHYQLDGGDDGLHNEGQRVEVEGVIESASIGIGMVGSILKVSSWKTRE